MPDLSIGFAALFGASVILFGAAYALLFAWGRLKGVKIVEGLSYVAFVLLVGSVYGLGESLHLAGKWQLLLFLLMLGYLLAPHGIWHLCVGTHADAHADRESEDPSIQQANAGR